METTVPLGGSGDYGCSDSPHGFEEAAESSGFGFRSGTKKSENPSPWGENGERRKFTNLLCQLQQAHVEEVEHYRSEVARLNEYCAAQQQLVTALRTTSADEDASPCRNSLVDREASKATAATESPPPTSSGKGLEASLFASKHGGGSEYNDMGTLRMSVSNKLVTAVKSATTRSGTPRPKRMRSRRNSLDDRLRGKVEDMPCHETYSFSRRMLGMVLSPWFETTFAIAIVLNAVVMALEVQKDGLMVGAQLQYPGIQWSDNEWPGADTCLSVLSWFFGITFTVEIILKLIGLKREFFLDWWNVLDFLIVAVWILSEVDSGIVPINLLLIRLARLMRLLRLMRLVRQMQAFDALYLMTTALRGSLSVLGWACVVLFVVQMFLALFLAEILATMYLTNPEYPQDDRREVYEYFGTFSRTMLSMFEITLANWPPVCRLLSENVTEWFVVLAVAHKLTIGFAVVGVINGVFMQETMKVASCDDSIMVRQKQLAIAMHERKMRSLFYAADTSGDGFLSAEEFRTILQREDVQTWLASMEFEANDIDNVFNLMDHGEGQVSVKQLIEGVARLKGAARSIDLVNLMTLFNSLQDTLMEVIAVRDQIRKISHHTNQDAATSHAMQVTVTAGETPSVSCKNSDARPTSSPFRSETEGEACTTSRPLHELFVTSWGKIEGLQHQVDVVNSMLRQSSREVLELKPSQPSRSQSGSDCIANNNDIIPEHGQALPTIFSSPNLALEPFRSRSVERRSL